MLILTRRIGEALRIGEDIKLVIAGLKDGQVRIGVDAPREIAVDRQELRERKQQEPRG